jgi:Mn2+/Fe2+ NRAMP family transporter
MSEKGSDTSGSGTSDVEAISLAKHFIQDPPQSFWGIIKKLGPGLIVAGSIVGSGELIATTATGAKAGIWLLWLIIIGCIIKVFVQVELGRFSISSGETTMTALDHVPGPRFRRRGNWLIWFWFLMFIASIAQLGGIVGGVGQALAISLPITQYGREYDAMATDATELAVSRAQYLQAKPGTQDKLTYAAEILQSELQYARDRAIVGIAANTDYPTTDLLQKKLTDSLATTSTDAQMSMADTLASMYPLCQQKKLIQDKAKQFSKSYPDPALWSDSQRATYLRFREQQEKLNAESDKVRATLVGDTQWLDQYEQLHVADKPATPVDDKIWAAIVSLITAVLLYVGRFNLIQTFSTAMVALFTLITIINLGLLQTSQAWSFSWKDIVDGMSFRLPPTHIGGGETAVSIALQTFGIIGVGAAELIAYPYWCLEKGYGRYAGPRDQTEAWAERARGWMRVMRWDAWCSMGVYTFATIAFYLLGASVLGRSKLEPAGSEMIRTLAVMYSPAFGEWAGILFLFGAFAVLYSTFFVANAGHARTVSDVLQVIGIGKRSERAYETRVKILSGSFPLVCFVIFVCFPQPVVLVLLSGLMQALMLPMLAFAAIFFRYRMVDRRIRPGIVWDAFLILSALAMLLLATWGMWEKLSPLFKPAG